MPTYSPLGIHKQNARSTSEGFNLQVVRRANMATSTALDAAGLANQWARGGMPFPVFRDYDFEPGHNSKYMTAGSAFAFCKNLVKAGTVDRRVYFNVNCEHELTDTVYDIYIGMIDRSMNEHDGVIGFVFSNAAHLTSYWDAAGNHYERPKAKAFLQKLWDTRRVKNANGYPAFILGDHWYTSGAWHMHLNGGEMLDKPELAFSERWATGELFVDWSKPQWHMNKPQNIMVALGWKYDPAQRKWVARDPNNPPTAGLPYILVTECLFGAMSVPALLAAYPNWVETPPFGKGKWGYKTHTEQWRAWYPDRFKQTYTNHPLYPGQVVEHGAGGICVDMMRMFWRYVCLPLGTVLGLHHYADGDTSGHDNLWIADNTRDDPGFYIAISSPPMEVIPYFDGQPEQPQPEPEPEPDMKAYVVTKAGAISTINVYANQTSHNVQPIGSVPSGARVMADLEAAPPPHDWVRVEYNGLTGWAPRQRGVVTWTLADSVPEPGTPPALPALNDDRWVAVKAAPMGSSSNIRAVTSTANNTPIGTLPAGINDIHIIPESAKTAAEAAYTKPDQHRWYIVKVPQVSGAEAVGYIREDAADVRFLEAGQGLLRAIAVSKAAITRLSALRSEIDAEINAQQAAVAEYESGL